MTTTSDVLTNRLRLFCFFCVGLCFSAAAAPVLTGVGEGRLSWTNDTAAGFYRVDWAPKGLDGLQTNWRSSWSGLVQQADLATNGFVSFDLPVFFRVSHATNAFPTEPAALNLSAGVAYPLSVWSSFEWPLDASSGRVYSVDWQAGTNWASSWNALCNIAATGLQMSCAIPMEFRLRSEWAGGTNSGEDNFILELGSNYVWIIAAGRVGKPGETRNVSADNFYIDKYETRVDFWNFIQEWASTNGYDLQPAAGVSNYPVNNVSWFEAVKFCNARSERSGRNPAYWQIDAVLGTTNVYRTGTNDVTWWRTNNSFRLPTEAEWEMAARCYGRGVGGGYNYYPWKAASITDYGPDHANYWQSCDLSELSGDLRTPVGGWSYIPSYIADSDPMTAITNLDEYLRQQSYIIYPYAPNARGVYDLAGNVSEWCWDRFAYFAFPPAEGSRNPRGPSAGDRRVHRGGSWGVPGEKCALFERGFDRPDKRRANIGFRCVKDY